MIHHLPNALTLGRIFCIPVLVALFFIPAAWGAQAACAVFVLAAVTDYFDGLLARRMETVSAFGKLLDPIADKMLVAATLLLLVGFDRMSPGAIVPALVILLREILISGLREFLAGLQALSLPVTFLAKCKTAVQMVALAVLILGEAGPAGWPLPVIGEAALWIAAVLTIVTGWDYVARGLQVIRVKGSAAG
ncbi:MAG: CDP-diacylglycerol--glycerol-3-phosphate 3-phosphatidyltransferase [Alphaproteobacteria bacterium]|nr:CDP-diacylglycerol--glycerol-3-phosphate 3-phosphatidyltransferase [Alphaproteobacteria bacterium]